MDALFSGSGSAAARLFRCAYCGLTAFPPFVDEAFHINFGRVVLRMGPLARSEEGRQFVVWLYILFGAQANAPLWIAPRRQPTCAAARFCRGDRRGAPALEPLGRVLAALLLIFIPVPSLF